MMELTLSCDHRILYGADAAEFLAKIREYLENPLARCAALAKPPTRRSAFGAAVGVARHARRALVACRRTGTASASGRGPGRRRGRGRPRAARRRRARAPARTRGACAMHVVVHRGGTARAVLALGARPPAGATGRRASDRRGEHAAAAPCPRSRAATTRGRSGRRRRSAAAGQRRDHRDSDQVREARQQHARDRRRPGRRRANGSSLRAATRRASVSTKNAGHSQAPRIRQRRRGEPDATRLRAAPPLTKGTLRPRARAEIPRGRRDERARGRRIPDGAESRKGRHARWRPKRLSPGPRRRSRRTYRST